MHSAESQYQNALRLLTTPEVRRAFELADEPATVREAYGRTKIGGRCLLARRLVEAGARFVMVDYGYDPDYGNIWDNHNAPAQNHPPIQEMCRRGYHLAGMDQAFAALIRDLDERGLLGHDAGLLPHRVRPHAARSTQPAAATTGARPARSSSPAAA